MTAKKSAARFQQLLCAATLLFGGIVASACDEGEELPADSDASDELDTVDESETDGPDEPTPFVCENSPQLDPELPGAGDVRFNEITMRCTHNSYHVEPEFPADPSHEYTHQPLDVQLGEYGVRAFELDVHGGPGFPVYHIPIIDRETTCETLGECLGTIATWSCQNPGHHMVVVWIEIKDELSAPDVTDYDAFDAVIRNALGDRLYTPDDFQGDYDSPRARLEAAGWPTVDETRGRVMTVLLDTDLPHGRDYTRNFTSTSGRAMFARASQENYDAPWAVVAKENNPRAAEAIALALEAGMLVASNTGSADNTDEENSAKVDAGVANGSHMLCDDFPGPVEGREHVLDIGDTTSICNTQTSGENCDANELDYGPRPTVLPPR